MRLKLVIQFMFFFSSANSFHHRIHHFMQKLDQVYSLKMKIQNKVIDKDIDLRR